MTVNVKEIEAKCRFADLILQNVRGVDLDVMDEVAILLDALLAASEMDLLTWDDDKNCYA